MAKPQKFIFPSVLFLCSFSLMFAQPATQGGQRPNEISYSREMLSLNEAIRHNFYDSAHGFYRESIYAEKNDNPYAYLWPLCLVHQAYNEMETARAGQGLVSRTSRIIQAYYDTSAPKPAFASYMPQFKKSSRFYDDNQWVGITSMDIYFRNKDVSYLNTGKLIYDFMMTGYDTVLTGGLYWKEDRKTSKNTCSNGPGIVLALQLYKATKERRYLDTALLLYQWVNTHLRDTSGLYYDNISIKDSKIGRRMFSYNTGTMLQSNVYLYECTGDKKYLQSAVAIADSSLPFFYGKDRFRDNYSFNAILLRAYQHLRLYNADNRYLRAFQKCLDNELAANKNALRLMGKDRALDLVNQGGMLEILARFSLLESKYKLNTAKADGGKLPGWAMGGFTRPPGLNPLISPTDKTTFNCPMKKAAIKWESNDTFNPAAVLKNGKVVVLYRAEDKSGVAIGERTSRIGYAESTDGKHFSRRSVPVIFPGPDNQQEFEVPGGCEDPRVAVTEDGTYVLFYTQWNRKVARIGVATSKDLISWQKHGPIFRSAFNGKFLDKWSKSASIVTRLHNDKLVVAKVNGKYFLYWGEESVFGATSSDLVNWEPVVDDNQNLKAFIAPRKGFFDSHLTECGPPAVITAKGILLLYNGKNLGDANGDQRFSQNSYCAGQVLFDANNPTKPLERLDVPFLRPMEPFEKSGQYAAGTVFIEGLVYFQKKWLLYYGCADSRVAIAVYDPANPALPDPMPTENQ